MMLVLTLPLGLGAVWSYIDRSRVAQVQTSLWATCWGIQVNFRAARL